MAGQCKLHLRNSCALIILPIVIRLGENATSDPDRPCSGLCRGLAARTIPVRLASPLWTEHLRMYPVSQVVRRALSCPGMTAGVTILLLAKNAEGAVLKELSQFYRHLLIPAFVVELQLPNEQSLR